MPVKDKLRVHIKNNHWGPDTFPNTPEGEDVFAITPERYAAIAARHPDVASNLDVFIDWDLEHFEKSMHDANVILAWNFPTENLSAVAPNLKAIQITGAGVEHLWPMDWLPADVVLTNSKGVHAVKAGEFGLMAILLLHNHVHSIMANQTKSIWKSLYATPIAGRTLLVIGVGNIGRNVATHAKNLGMTVLGISRHGASIPSIDEMGTPDELESFLPRADFVFLATPATPETRNMLDRRRLGVMKHGSYIINVGRSAVIDYVALEEMLHSGHLGGAVLDVFDPEPLPASSSLWQAPNLVITPHVSGDDARAYMEITLELFFDNMRRLLSGRPLRNVVNTALGY